MERVSLPELMSRRSVFTYVVSYMIISAASRSGAMACFPAGSFLSVADWSIAVGVRSVDVDDFVLAAMTVL